jgi:TetR/AcrR family transcriptional regulator
LSDGKLPAIVFERKTDRSREAGVFPTKEDIHGIKRRAVLQEAAASFNLKGYHGTSLNEIAASLGVTKAALYHYFPNKNTLLAACFDYAMAAAFASLERGRKQGRNGRERLVLTITGYVAELIDELNCCVVLMEEQALEPEDRAKLVRERDKFERALRALVREGIADGSVAPCDPKLAIFVILGAMNWVPKWFKPSGAWKPEQLTRALGDIFDRAISSTPAAAMARDVGDLPLGEPAKAGQGGDAARANERKRRDEMVESRGRLRRAGKVGAPAR